MMVRYDPYTDSFIDNPTRETTATINLDAFPKNIIQMNVVEVSDASIEKIADAVVRKLADRKTEPTISKMEQVETMSCQECKHFHENAVMYLDQCDFCFKDCKYEPKDEPQTDCQWK